MRKNLQIIVVDWGTEFFKAIFKEACKLLQIKQLSSTEYYHRILKASENTYNFLGVYLEIETVY